MMIRKKVGGPTDFQGGRDHSQDQGISFLSRVSGAGVYKVLIFGDNYRGISSRSRPPEEESQRPR